MNDETKAALAWIREMLGADRRPVARNLLAHLDGEPARLAAAREEQREACARRVKGAIDRYDYSDDASEEAVHDACVDACGDTPLDATPLADELRTLRARVAELEAFIVDACREKTLHGSTPSLIAGASKLGIAAFEAWWAERAEESKP